MRKSFQSTENEPIISADEFNRLFGEHARSIAAHVRTLVPNSQDADDVFQETVATLWEKFDQFQAGSSFYAWACRIAYYKALQHRDRKIRGPRPFSPEFLESVSEEMVVMADLLDARTEALAGCREKLVPADRDLLERYYRTGATANAIAAEMQRSVHYVYRAMRRIHSLLFDCIDRTVRRGA